jgi:hypothetical protein
MATKFILCLMVLAGILFAWCSLGFVRLLVYVD